MTIFFPDNSMTFPWHLVKFLTFPWHNSLTFPSFPDFPDKWSPCFLRRLPATGRKGAKIPRGISDISSSRAQSDKIPTATPPMFSGSSFLMVVLPISWNVDVCQKSKTAARLPEAPITLLVLQIHMSFQKQHMGLWLCTKHRGTSLAIMADATSCRKSKMADN